MASGHRAKNLNLASVHLLLLHDSQPFFIAASLQEKHVLHFGLHVCTMYI